MRRRLIAASAGTSAVGICAFATLAIVLTSNQLHAGLDRALRSRAVGIDQLAVSAPAVLTEPGALESPASGRQIVVEVLDRSGRILARSALLGAHLLPRDRVVERARAAGAGGFEDLRVGGRSFRLYAAPIASVGGPAAGGVVLVASDTTDIGQAVSHLALLLALIGAGLLLASVLASMLFVRRGIRPLGRLVAGAVEIERTGDPSRRLPERTIEDEVDRLTSVLNRMLASLERSRAGERRFLADASHELRTPVTALRGNVEFARRHGVTTEVLEELDHDTARLARLVDQLLASERVEGGTEEIGRVYLGELVAELIASDYADQRVRVDVEHDGMVAGDHRALARAVQNVVDNALMHGPAGGEVTVTVGRIGDRALITVRDQGDGPAPADREHLFERFWRGADAADRPGSGLGLAIVQAIVLRHGGSIDVQGSSFTISLPLA